jgi:hypothetical protein
VVPLEHGDESEDRVEETTWVGHQQLLVPHLQRRHKQLQKSSKFWVQVTTTFVTGVLTPIGLILDTAAYCVNSMYDSFLNRMAVLCFVRVAQ